MGTANLDHNTNGTRKNHHGKFKLNISYHNTNLTKKNITENEN